MAPAAPANPRTIRFGVFELDLKAGELRKQGLKIKLQEQPFQILVMLLERPGEVVTREEIQQKLWSADTFVDFEHGINAAVKRLREALDDSADNPRFVETLARRGYRFIYPVETVAPVYDRRRDSPLTERRYSVWAAALLAAALAIALGIWILQRTKETPEAELVPSPLTSYPGYEGYPSFSPDGTQVAFQWCTDEPSANCDIYIKQIGVEPASRLTTDPAEDFSPAWSPDGQFIAFLRKLSATRTALILIPQRGGQERLLGESDVTNGGQLYGPHLAWTPDSKWLVLPWGEADKPAEGLFMINVETGDTRRLTSSPMDTAPAFSPDGQTLAFNRLGTADRICLLPLTKGFRPQGELRQLALANDSYDANHGAAWTPNGSDIVFSTGNQSSVGLWRVAASVSARPRRLVFASDGASAPAVSRQGNRLAYKVRRTDTNIWRLDLRSPGHNPGIPAQLIASTRQERDPAYSPDGRRIAFVSDRSGSWETWVCGSDGSNPVQLTALGGPIVMGPRWSSDGRSIAMWAAHGVYVVSANGGVARRVSEQVDGGRWPSWSRDGQSVYFSWNRSGAPEIWKMPAAGGEAVQISGHGGDVPQESPDGRFVYYEKGWPSQCSVWKAPVGGSEEINVLDSVHCYAGWTLGKQGIYFFTPPDTQGLSDIRLYKFATGATTKILTIERDVAYRIAVSPDERTILYGQLDQAGSDLMLVENFH